MARDMRAQQSNNGTDDQDIDLHEVLQLQARNEAKDNEHCVSLPLEDILRGPGHVAWKLIQDLKENPNSNFEFRDEQLPESAYASKFMEGHSWYDRAVEVASQRKLIVFLPHPPPPMITMRGKPK